MIGLPSLLTVLLMATVTYLTRIVGFLALRNRTLSPKATKVMEAAPGCVLLSVIAPAFVADRPADLIALALTLIAASRLPMLPTVLIGIAAPACSGTFWVEAPSPGLAPHVRGDRATQSASRFRRVTSCPPPKIAKTTTSAASTR